VPNGPNQQLLMVGAAASRPPLHLHLQNCGYEILTAASTNEAMHVLARWKIACVVADGDLDQGHEAWLIGRILQSEPGLAVVLLAGRPDVRDAVSSIRLGAFDYLAANESPEAIGAAVGRAIQQRRVQARERMQAQSLQEELSTLAAEVRRERERGDRVALAALESLVHVVEAKDMWLAGHSVRVAQTAASIAAELGRADAEIEQVRIAGRLHDIGMVGVDDGILSKQGPLTPEEFDRVRGHADLGSRILAPLPGLGPIASFVRHHHERWDGEGYPDRLAGEAVPWGARIIGVAEIYDALTTERPYRQSMAPDLAVGQMNTLIGAAIGAAEWDALASVVGRREALVFVVDGEAQAVAGARVVTMSL
jgi:cyclic di-GMP phosphodiesterase